MLISWVQQVRICSHRRLLAQFGTFVHWSRCCWHRIVYLDDVR